MMDICDPKVAAQTLRELADLVEQDKVHLALADWDPQYEVRLGPNVGRGALGVDISTTPARG
jgi:hypothetical protein